MHFCNECNCFIPDKVFRYSNEMFGFSLCYKHQSWYKEILSVTTEENLLLYFALKERGVPAEIEKFDGYKHIDIAIPQARVNIEVDGRQHNTDHRQALSDLKRTYHSFLKGFLTLRIPNSLVRENVEETADYILDILKINVKRSSGYRQ